MILTVPSGRTLGSHPLVYVLDVQQQQPGRLELMVPAPEGYGSPLVSARETAVLGKGVLARVSITVFPPKKSVPKNDPWARARGTDMLIFVHGFYIKTALFPKLASSAETRVFRGLGREMMLFALTAAAQHLVSPRLLPTTEVRLEASGGECKDVPNISAAEAWRYLKQFPYTYQELKEEEDELTLEDLREAVCSIRENQRLVKYYNQTLGLRVIDASDGMGVYMAEKLNVVMARLRAGAIARKVVANATGAIMMGRGRPRGMAGSGIGVRRSRV